MKNFFFVAKKSTEIMQVDALVWNKYVTACLIERGGVTRIPFLFLSRSLFLSLSLSFCRWATRWTPLR